MPWQNERARRPNPVEASGSGVYVSKHVVYTIYALAARGRLDTPGKSPAASHPRRIP
jgi:hypothetical protein